MGAITPPPSLFREALYAQNMKRKYYPSCVLSQRKVTKLGEEINWDTCRYYSLAMRRGAKSEWTPHHTGCGFSTWVKGWKRVNFMLYSTVEIRRRLLENSNHPQPEMLFLQRLEMTHSPLFGYQWSWEPDNDRLGVYRFYILKLCVFSLVPHPFLCVGGNYIRIERRSNFYWLLLWISAEALIDFSLNYRAKMIKTWR